MKYTKAEAKAYNDNIKNNMSAKNKAELLFDDLIRFAKLELKIRASIGIKKDDALARVVQFNKYDNIKFANAEFFKELNYSLDMIIDGYSDRGESLESKVAELKTNKEKQNGTF
ncbi:MAG: hypothetical protein IJ965_07920 [Campylobacter sp.]|nr:hypothetical protein [Campylobacter sp.]